MAAAKQVRRLLTIMAHLHAHPGSDVDQLAEVLRVSTRTVFRDLAVLERVGSGVRAAGGYQVQAQLFTTAANQGLGDALKGLVDEQVNVLQRSLPAARFEKLMRRLELTLPQEVARAMAGALEDRKAKRVAVSKRPEAVRHTPVTQLSSPKSARRRAG